MSLKHSNYHLIFTATDHFYVKTQDVLLSEHQSWQYAIIVAVSEALNWLFNAKMIEKKQLFLYS